MDKQLLRKYNVPGPRYTSYPTVPYWDTTPPSIEAWKEAVRFSFDRSNDTEGISLYIHLPFCQSLCTYCGCNTRITVNHAVEEPYIEALLEEWQRYVNLFGTRPRLREIHLGGGTPTFFSPENLQRLIGTIIHSAEVCEEHNFGFEGHPNNTRPEHLQALYDLGFRRVSYGIQDFDPRVQKIVNRIQSFDTVKSITEISREIGYTSVNYDLIYGLPLQIPCSVIDTVKKVKELQPDRIALYSYAHVPWVKPGQRSFTKADLPLGEHKRTLYELGKEMLENAGYRELGMDHFALESDSLYQAFKEGRMHRNFMGYTEFHTRLMVGLGTSSISDAWEGFAQNEKKVEDYYQALKDREFPIFRGHLLTDEDRILRRHLLNPMCHFETAWLLPELQHPSLQEGLARMDELVADGLVEIGPEFLRVTSKGEPFIRNICMALDARLARQQAGEQVFSRTV